MNNKILVVDDEPDLELLITQRFRSKIRAGELAFEFAHNGAQALEKLKADDSIDLIFTDINMPVMDGLTLLNRIKEEKLSPKAVVISAYGDLDNIRSAMNRGAFDFITKPIDMTDLETTLNKGLGEIEVIKQGIKAQEELIKTRGEKEIAILEKQKAEESKQLKQQFLANMSHEIRTPMNAIIASINLLRNTQMNEAQNKYTSIIKKSADNLLVIINDILDSSKIEAGKLSIENIPFNLLETVENVYESLKIKAQEKNINFTLDFPKEAHIFFLGDPVRISQVLINLGGNAIKFTDKGYVKLVVQVAAHQAGSYQVTFKVIDSGIGIAPDKIGMVFESFTQESGDTTRKYGGTGLGLTISKQLVELMHGTISADSEPGKGSVFSFVLPMTPVDASRIVQHEAPPAEGTIKLENVYILLAEDNLMNQEVATDTLKDLIPGVRIDVVDNGKLAVEKLPGSTYEIVIMDIHMPEMDGYEATKYIREKLAPPYNTIPVLAMTANVIPEEIQKCFDSGMNAYVPKPFQPHDLLAKIANLIKK
jgi:signal transduction histidine kinase